MPRSLRSGPFFRLRQGRRRRWPSRAMPGSARPWCGSTCSRPLAAHPGCCRASPPRRNDRSPSRRLMTCSARSPRRSFRRFRGRGRRAVEVALLRDASPGPRSAGLPRAGRPVPEPRVLARGILDALRILSGDAPLMIAVDDAQWLDRPSAGVLEFCFRRLQREPVSILLTFRTDDPVPLGLDRALPLRSPWPCAAGSAEPGRDRRDPAVTAGGRAAPVRPHPAV